jgi:flagellar hook-associated protein 2
MATVGSVTSGITAKTGIGGLSSGMDIDSMILKMTAASRQKVTKQEQALQKLEWKQSAYRSVTNALTEFRNKYLNSLSATNFKSSNLFNTIRASVNSEVKAFTATAQSTAAAGKAYVNSIQQLATSETITNNAAISGKLEAAATVPSLAALRGNDFMVSLDGVSRTVAFDDAFMADLHSIVRDDLLKNDSGNLYGGGGAGASADQIAALDAAVKAVMEDPNAAQSADIMGYMRDAVQVGVNRLFENPPAPTAPNTAPTYKDYLGISTPKIMVTEKLIATSTTTTGGTTVTTEHYGLNFDTRDGSKLTLGYATQPLTPAEKKDTETTEYYNMRVKIDEALAHRATGLGMLGFTDKQSNRLNIYSSLADLRAENGTIKINGALFKPTPTLSPDGTAANNYRFIINNTSISVSEDESVYSLMNKINSSQAGVTLSYSEVTDKFTLTAKQQGAGENIVMGDVNGNLLMALGLQNGDIKWQDSDGTEKTTAFSGAAPAAYGQNAVAYIDGQKIERTSNEFTVNGVAYSLKELYNESWTPTTGSSGNVMNATDGEAVTLSPDATDLQEHIKNFITDYNALVDLLYGLTSEDSYSDYEPLTEEQRAAMSENQVKLWEDKAKSGLLRSDSTVSKILSSLRESFFTSSDGFNLYNMGITYGGLKEHGKLKITDEAKLKSALESQPDRVRDFFTNASKGAAVKIDKVIDDAVRTTGGQGHRGSLIELAGLPSTMSEDENALYTQMANYSKRITTLKEQLQKEESRLWSQFSAMETALSKLNEQSGLITQYFGKKSS